MQGTQGSAGMQEMERLGGMQGVQGYGGMPTFMGSLCQGSAMSLFQALGKQRGVCQASSLGVLLTSLHHSSAHASPIPAPVTNGNGHGGIGERTP